MRFQSAAILCAVLAVAAPAAAQSSHQDATGSTQYRAPRARRHFVSLSYDWVYAQPYRFGQHPLSDLLGRQVNEVHLQSYQYETADGATRVAVGEFSHRLQGLGVTLYPFGSSQGATLAVRGSIEQLPAIRVSFDGPAPVSSYELTNGRAIDAAIGVDMSDRSPGWGLGSHAFVLGGIGRAKTDQVNGTRYFAEGGGGLAVGPVGVDLSFKFVVNRFDEPVPHQVFNIPIAVRGTLTF